MQTGMCHASAKVPIELFCLHLECKKKKLILEYVLLKIKTLRFFFNYAGLINLSTIFYPTCQAPLGLDLPGVDAV
jgi:hypothetical protein